MICPMVNFDVVSLAEANALLLGWGHRMGPCERAENLGSWCHAMFHEGNPVAVTVTCTLIRDHVGGGFGHLTRANCCELARVCAARPTLCRAAVRLWREFVFPSLGYSAVISYQDAVMHRGEIYRCDGWVRSPERSRSGTDARTGKRGRDKWVWVWPRAAVRIDSKQPSA